MLPRLACLTLLAALPGCVVIPVPTQALQVAGDKLSGQGEHCVNAAAQVGEIVFIRTGQTFTRWKVEAITGPAPDRCPDPDRPYRARLSPL